MPDVSLMVTARDNYSAAISKMCTVSKEFQAQMTQLDARLTKLNNNKATLRVSADQAKSELQAARKQFAATGDEVDRLNLLAAQSNYDNIQSNLKLVGDMARKTEQDMRGLTDELTRQQNRAGGPSGGSSPAGRLSTNDMMSQLGKAGLSQMVGNLASHALGTFTSSAFGDTLGDAISSTVSSVASGAAIGTMIAPGIGTAIGAAAGAVVGVFDSAISVFEKKDDAFKQTVQERYEATQQAFADSLSAGSGIAAGREMSMQSWTTLLGSGKAAEKFVAEMREMAAVTPYAYDDLDQMSKVLKTYGYQQKEILPTLTAIGDAGAALGMPTANIEMMATALGRMKTTDKASLEYINLLTERGIGVVDWLAERDSLSTSDVYSKISKGEYSGKETADYIIQRMQEAYGGAMDIQSRTFEGLTSTLDDARAAINNAMGEGYNALRKEGMSAEIDFLSGDTGAKMEEAYAMIGQWKASLDNLQEQYQRDAMTAVMEGTLGSFDGTEIAGRLQEMAEEYQALLADYQAGDTSAGAKMGELLAEAQVIAQNEYLASEGYSMELNAQMDLINKIQSDGALNSSYYNAGLQLGQELSKGLVSAVRSGVSQAEGVLGSLNSGARAHGGGRGSSRGVSNAWGQRRVPYDGYFTMLHEGERVLTAQEARNADAGGASVAVQVMGNLVVREEADVDAIAARLAEEISMARSVAI